MEKGSSHLVFVYGTLKRNEPNHDLIEKRTKGKAVFIGNALTVKKWPLVIASRYNIPYILYYKNNGKKIMGEVYEIDSTMLATLDELEAHPNYYTRLMEEAELCLEKGNSKKLIRPWIYFLKDFHSKLLDLPCLSDYSSKGSHGLEYVSRDKGPTRDDYYSDVKNL